MLNLILSLIILKVSNPRQSLGPFFFCIQRYLAVCLHKPLRESSRVCFTDVRFWLTPLGVVLLPYLLDLYVLLFQTMSETRKQEEKDAKVLKFEAFIEQKLKPDLVRVISERDKVMEQQKIFSDLSKNIKLLEQNRLKKLKTLVNLGSEVYAQAEVSDTSKIFVDIGLGFHVEFTWSEALQFITVKQERLSRQVEELTHQIANIKAQIKLVGEGIKEILNLSQETTIHI